MCSLSSAECKGHRRPPASTPHPCLEKVHGHLQRVVVSQLIATIPCLCMCVTGRPGGSEREGESGGESGGECMTCICCVLVSYMVHGYTYSCFDGSCVVNGDETFDANGDELNS